MDRTGLKLKGEKSSQHAILEWVRTSPWAQVLVFVGIALIGLGVRVYNLNGIPAATWGDLIEHYRLVHVVWAGKLTFSTWFGGDGPLYPLLAAGFTSIVGLSFLHLKLFSALIGSGLVVVTYLYAGSLFDKQVAWIAALVAAVSFWGVTYSRQGKPYILVAVLFGLLLYLLVKRRWIWSGVVIGLGMLVQASFWGALLLSFYRWQTALVAWLLSIPAFFKMEDVFKPSDYIGGKVNFHLSAWELARRLAINVFKNIGAFFWHGDPGFRATIPNAPLLDPLSSFFFAAGLIAVLWWAIKSRKRSYLTYIVIPFLAIQIPSLMDVVNYRFNPNSGRMIGVLPVIYLLVALGLVTVGKKLNRPWVRNGFLGLSLCLIAGLNLWNYYAVYPRTLPNHNVPFAETIAAYLNQSPQVDHVIMVECCWGEYGQPEPDGIRFEMQNPGRFIYMPEKNVSLNVLQAFKPTGPLLLILNPKDLSLQEKFSQLYPDAKMETLQKGGYQVAQLMLIDNPGKNDVRSQLSGGENAKGP